MLKILNWNGKIYTLPTRVTINTNLCMFQYKLLHNNLYLNEMLYKFGKKATLPFLHRRT